MEITKTEYRNALKIVKQFEKQEQKLKWSCDKCKKKFTNSFDQEYCEDDFDLSKGKNCKGKNFSKEKRKPIKWVNKDDDFHSDLDGRSISDWEMHHGHGFWGNSTTGYHYDEDVKKWD